MLNPPGRWSYFISHTQRSGRATTIAERLAAGAHGGGLDSVWFDVKMGDNSEAAMKEGVQNSSVVIAILTDDGGAGNAYFQRPFCVDELRWAQEAGIFIQPVVAADDKQRIGELLSMAPEDLRKLLGSTDFIHLDRADHEYWAVGCDKIRRQERIRGGSASSGSSDSGSSSSGGGGDGGVGGGDNSQRELIRLCIEGDLSAFDEVKGLKLRQRLASELNAEISPEHVRISKVKVSGKRKHLSVGTRCCRLRVEVSEDGRASFSDDSSADDVEDQIEQDVREITNTSKWWPQGVEVADIEVVWTGRGSVLVDVSVPAPCGLLT